MRKGERRTALAVTAVVAVLLFHTRPLLAQPARVYIDSAVVAIGGRDALLGLKSQRIVSHGENFEPEQTLRPGAEPRKGSNFTCTLTPDLTNGKVGHRWHAETVHPV